VKPKTVVVKVEKVGPGPKKASFTKELEQPKKSIIISNAVKPPPVAVVKPSIKSKPATKKMEQPLDYSLSSHLSKANSGTKGMENSSSSDSTDSSFNRHHASLFAVAGHSKKQDEVANLETSMVMDDKEEKKAADDEVGDTVIRTMEPKKARGCPAAAVAAPAAPAAAAASNKNKKNNNKNKLNDAPPRHTRGAAARK
jgi:hypothetical protein